VTALIVPNFANLQAKAEELGCAWESASGMIQSKALHEFMAERVERVMQAVSQPERVRAFLLLDRPFQLENDELTATLKVRRRHLIGKYLDRLDALYAKIPGHPEE
jgi:long-chain acyl-CoA synthetase